MTLRTGNKGRERENWRNSIYFALSFVYNHLRSSNYHRNSNGHPHHGHRVLALLGNKMRKERITILAKEKSFPFIMSLRYILFRLQ